jgi:hypothetical protein
MKIIHISEVYIQVLCFCKSKKLDVSLVMKVFENLYSSEERMQIRNVYIQTKI